MAKSKRTKAKKKAWDAVSRYVRLRDCYKHSKDYYAKCCTCNNWFHFKKLQAGHFIPGRLGANLWDVRGIHAQCYGCNHPGRGQPIRYEHFMEVNYGSQLISDLRRQAKEVKKYTISDFEDIYNKYQVMANDLEGAINESISNTGHVSEKEEMGTVGIDGIQDI